MPPVFAFHVEVSLRSLLMSLLCILDASFHPSLEVLHSSLSQVGWDSLALMLTLFPLTGALLVPLVLLAHSGDAVGRDHLISAARSEAYYSIFVL